MHQQNFYSSEKMYVYKHYTSIKKTAMYLTGKALDVPYLNSMG